MVNTIMQQQFYLNCLGFNAGAVDGLAGIRTATAIAAFMQKHRDGESRYPELIKRIGELKIPRHLRAGAELLGEKEIPGTKHNLKIVAMWEWLKNGIRNDETPWCSSYVGDTLIRAGIETPKLLQMEGITAAARSWEKYSIESDGYLGDIAVFWRGHPDSWSGHVGFVVGKTENGDFWILGGNQGNAVSVVWIDKRRLLSFRHVGHHFKDLPLVTAKAPVSENEA